MCQLRFFMTAFAVVWTLNLSALTPVKLNFDTDANGNAILPGQVIDEEYAGWGVHITTTNFVRDFSKGISFDSLNPTGGDWDLQTGPGTSNPSYGNVLIISERNDDLNSDGRIDVPDNEESVYDGPNPNKDHHSGYIQLFFDNLCYNGNITLLDVSYYEAEILFFLAGARLTSRDVIVPVGPSGSLQAFSFSGFTFDMIRVYFGSGGAIAEVWVNTPEPGTWIVMSSSILVAAYIYRRKKRVQAEESSRTSS